MTMIHIGSGAEFTETYDGQKIEVVGQRDGERLSLFSAKTDGKVTGFSLQTLSQIATAAGVRSAMNANYFDNVPNSPTHGMALGVRCGVDEWSVPRHGAYYYYAQLVGGKTEVGLDTSFWWTDKECIFACSPAQILIKDGQTVNYISPDTIGSKDLPTQQSMLIRTSERFAFAVCSGELFPEQCRQWALTIEGIQDLCLMDSGGSSGLYDEGRMIVPSDRPITDALAFYGGSMANRMNGIDISNWQKNIDLTRMSFDFVICKATEGLNFVDAYCDKFVQTAIRMGKPFGFYHFARPTNDPLLEARFFVKNTLNYFSQGIPVLDWEAEHKEDVQWALTWLNEVQKLTGVKPLIYMSESVVNAYDWSPVVAGDFGLWVAKYRDYVDDPNYDMTNAGPAPKVKWWNGYAMWQWTSVGKLDGYSGSLDCDIFYGNSEAWSKYAKPQAIEAPQTDTDILRAKVTELEATVKELQERIERAQKALRGETK